MRKMIGKLGILLVALLIISVSFSAYALNVELRPKPFKINAAITDSIAYNNNPGFANRRDADSGFGNKLGGELALELPFGRVHKYTANSKHNWMDFFDYTKYDYIDNTVTQSLDLLFNKWTLNLHNKFDNSHDPNLEELPGATGRGLMRRSLLNGGFVLQGDMGKFDLTTGFDYDYYWTNDAYNILDRDTFAPYVETAFKVNPRLDVFLRGAYTRINRRSVRMNSGNWYDGRVGVRGEITSYLAGEVEAGYGYVDFNKHADGGDGDSDNYSDLVCEASLTNRLNKLITQKVSFKYLPEPGYNGGANYYKAISTKYNVDYRLNNRINLTGLFEYLHSKESGSRYDKEEANMWKYGGGLSIALIKNLSLVGEYTYSQKDSNRHGKGYQQHFASVGARYSF